MEGEWSSTKSSGTAFEVFLNFRGTDTRQGFTNCLFHFMEKAGICTFMDDESMRKGDPISGALFQAIEVCKIYVCIFSKSYASSSWCLRELKRMVDLKDASKEKTILPIFYDVTPYDVKLKTELYKKDLVKLEEDLVQKKHKNGEKMVEGWKIALERVGRIKGYSLKDQGFVGFIESIVGNVLLMLKEKSVTKHPVEMTCSDKQVISKLLSIGCGDVRFIGIHGVGGIGKTTLARFLFHQFSAQFDGCCFLEKVGELSRQKAGVAFLKDQLLSSIPDIERDKTMREKFRNKKVFIVLDDVSEWKQITQLVGKSYWFGPGSRIIITAREKSALMSKNQVQEILHFKMNEMDDERALQLFSRHAFGRELPQDEYRVISSEIVADIGRIPLALEIIGSFLHRKGKDEWTEPKRKLQGMSHMEIQEKLMISYEKLSHEAKEVFLDVACFYADKEKTKPLYMWEVCHYQGNKPLASLIYMSFVKVMDNDRLWMHDEVKDLGRSIVEREKKLSRLWMPKEALDMLNNDQMTKETEALCLSLDPSLERAASAEDFEKLRGIRFLEMDGPNFEGNCENSLRKLKWLALYHSPSDFTATNLSLISLVILDLSRSLIGDDWRGWTEIQAVNLKVLDLTDCKNITKTPNLSSYTALERLVLQGCDKLNLIGKSIGLLKKLTHLNVKGCDSLMELPEEVCPLTELQEIRVSKGDHAKEKSLKLPESIGNELKSLLTLEIADVEIDRLPESIGKLEKLKRLYLQGCSVKERLPDSLGKLASLTEFDLSRAKITALPDSIFCLKKLKVIKMACSSILHLTSAPVEAEELQADKHADLAGEIPGDIQDSPCLTTLDLSDTGICRLPDKVSELSQLQTLRLGSRNRIEQLPKLPKSLTSLHISSLMMVPDLSELENLTDLLIALNEDSPSSELQATNLDWIGKLSKLTSLQLSFPSATSLQQGLNALTRLITLDLSFQNVQGSLELPSSLLSLSLRHFKTVLPNLSTLKNLSILRCYDCLLEDGSDSSFIIAKLDHLKHFLAENCDIRMVNGLSLPESLSILSITNCNFMSSEGRARSGFVNLSGLNDLKQLKLSNCKELSEIRGLGDLKSLQELIIQHCHSLETLGSLSNLKQLEVLELIECKNLSIKDPQGLKFLNFIRVIGVRVCRSF